MQLPPEHAERGNRGLRGRSVDNQDLGETFPVFYFTWISLVLIMLDIKMV